METVYDSKNFRDKTKKNIARIISVARKKRSFTQKDFARKCGLSQSYVSKIENGTIKIRATSWFIICEILDLPVECIKFHGDQLEKFLDNI